MKVRIGSEVVATVWVHPIEKYGGSLISPGTKGRVVEVYRVITGKRLWFFPQLTVRMIAVDWELSDKERIEYERWTGAEVTARRELSYTYGIRVNKL